MILTGETIDATEALRIGLLSSVVPVEELEKEGMDWAKRLSQGAPRALAYAKEALRRGGDLSLAEGIRLEADLTTLLQTTNDRLEGAAAFRERRQPNFRNE